jgi:hypothetical protein
VIAYNLTQAKKQALAVTQSEEMVPQMVAKGAMVIGSVSKERGGRHALTGDQV